MSPKKTTITMAWQSLFLEQYKRRLIFLLSSDLSPLGTVVGAAVGIGLDYVISKDFDLDRDGESHSLIGATKDGLHNLLGIG